MKKVLLIATTIILAAFVYSLSAKEGPKSEGDQRDPRKAKASSAPRTESNGLVWYSYPEALKISKKENKHVFVHFTATWCGWCKKMERETYTDSSIIKTLNKDFVCSKVWGDTDSLLEIDGYQISERALAQSQFGIRSYPTLWFVAPSGVKVGPVPGYRAAPDLQKILDFVRDYKYDTTRTQNSGQGDKSGK